MSSRSEGANAAPARVETRFVIRGTPAWKDWVKELAARSGYGGPLELIEAMLKKRASQAGLADPPPRAGAPRHHGKGRPCGPEQVQAGTPKAAFAVPTTLEYKAWAESVAAHLGYKLVPMIDAAIREQARSIGHAPDPGRIPPRAKPAA